MATNTKKAAAKAKKKYIITVDTNPGFCGVDAGGVQFAHGEAIIEDERLANWFGEHAGYNVSEVVEETAEDEAEEGK